MKRERIRQQPCVILPSSRLREQEEHVIHGTEWRARRNARMTAYLGYRFHVHETVVPTLWGRVVKTARWLWPA